MAIEAVESRLRMFATNTAVVTGWTEMRFRARGGDGVYGQRLAHTYVFVAQDGHCQRVSFRERRFDSGRQTPSLTFRGWLTIITLLLWFFVSIHSKGC